MARPKKFRLTPDDVLDPENAKKLAGFVGSIEELRKDAERISGLIADVYDDADEDGFDKGLIRKTVARRAKPAHEIEAEEHGVESYTRAVLRGFSSRARVENHFPDAGNMVPHDADGVIIEPPSAEPAPLVEADAPEDVTPISSLSGATQSPTTNGGSDANASGSDLEAVNVGVDQDQSDEAIQRQGSQHAFDTTPAESAAGEISAPIPTEFERIQAEMVAQRLALRPHCKRPTNCLGSGERHCSDCQQAHAEAEGFSA